MLVVAACGAVALLGATRLFAADVYDTVIVKMTAVWYHAVLAAMPDGARVLDVGIGTGTALVRNKSLLVKKQIQIVGVDYDEDYINKAKKIIAKEGLDSLVTVYCKSVYDDDLAAATTANEKPFDFIYFSGSFTLLPSPTEALKSTAKLLKKGKDARIYITQTFQRDHFINPVIAWVKPLAKYITRIDFGQLTREQDMLFTIKDAGMLTERNEVIPGSIDTSLQAARMVTIIPRLV